MKREYLPALVPQKPGVYVFRDKFGRVIYVGKAKNLRKRLGNYFQEARVRRADAKTRSLIKSIDDWTKATTFCLVLARFTSPNFSFGSFHFA